LDEKSKGIKLALVSFFVALGRAGVFALILISNIVPAFAIFLTLIIGIS
jgi:hypothetical protein